MKKLLLLLVLVSLMVATMTASAQGTAFAYQGRLENNGTPANGNYDLTFALYTTNAGGVSVAGPVTDSNTPVTNGLFSVTIDFGSGVFAGNNYWLDISVSPAGSNTFTDLTPRQPILPTPYAMMASSASNLLGRLPASQVSGTIPMTQLSSAVLTNMETGVTLSGAFNGNGSGLTTLNPANLSAGTAAINISGNAATATSATTAGSATSAATATSAVTATTAATATLASNLVSGASILNAFITNSTFAGNGGGLTNLNASQLHGSVPSASLTSVPAASLTGTVPLAELPSAILTNKETGVTLSGTFSGSFSGVTNLTAASISTNGSTSGQVLTSSGGATVWANANPWMGGSPTLVTNSTLSTNAVLVGRDRGFFLGFVTSAANQQTSSNYFTIKLSQALSTNAVLATYSPGAEGKWTNSPISIDGLVVFEQTFQLVTTSNSITVQSIVPPATSSSYGLFVHVDQY